MTEKELRASIVEAALAWLGRREADGSFRVILEAYNAIRPLPALYAMKDTDPWCAAFVSAAAARAGLTEIVFPECSCPRMMALYKAAGRWEEVDFAVPKPGDVVFYDWNGDRVPEHVGLVAAVEGDWLTAVEGNKSDAVGKRRLHLDSPYILGYGQPDYFHYAESPPCLKGGGAERRGDISDNAQPADVGADAPIGPRTASDAEADASVLPPGGKLSPQATDEGEKTASPSSVSSADIFPPQGGRTCLPLPLLSPGDRGETVRAAQLLLIGRGWSCGSCGADGDFGAATRGAVLRCQRARGLEADGLIGEETWSCLLGVSA